MNVIDGVLQAVKDLTSRITRLESLHYPRRIHLQEPLTSTSWDGDAYSTTAKTLIDLSAVFGVPAGVKEITAMVSCADTDSTSGDDNYVMLSPNDTAGQGLAVRSKGRYDNDYETQVLTIPCNADGDVYYQIVATGAGSMKVYIEIWGYEI